MQLGLPGFRVLRQAQCTVDHQLLGRARSGARPRSAEVGISSGFCRFEQLVQIDFGDSLAASGERRHRRLPPPSWKHRLELFLAVEQIADVDHGSDLVRKVWVRKIAQVSFELLAIRVLFQERGRREHPGSEDARRLVRRLELTRKLRLQPLKTPAAD
jgi:hypothetical protein